MKKNIGTLMLGAAFLIVGGSYVVSFALGQDPKFFFDGWWTLFLIIPAIASMIETRINLGNVTILAIGVLLLANAQGWIEKIGFVMVLAVLFIIFGVYFIYRSFSTGRKAANGSGDFGLRGNWRQDRAKNPTYNAFFVVTNIRNDTDHLLGATCNATLGGLRVDLSKAVIQNDITIFGNAVFGNLDIIAPRGVKLKYRSIPIFGTVDVKTNGEPEGTNCPTVTLDCTSIFGGVAIY